MRLISWVPAQYIVLRLAKYALSDNLQNKIKRQEKNRDVAIPTQTLHCLKGDVNGILCRMQNNARTILTTMDFEIPRSMHVPSYLSFPGQKLLLSSIQFAIHVGDFS